MIFVYTGSLQLNMELYEPEMNGRDCDDYHHDHWKRSQNDAKFVVTGITVTTYDATSHSQTTPSASSHPLQQPRTGVGPTHLWLLAD